MEGGEVLVVGNGLIAKAFADYINNDDVIIFASGVSDSGCTDPLQFQKEEKLLRQTLYVSKDKTIVYFSSAATTKSAYFFHKRYMESIAMMNEKHIILRLPQVVGVGGNPNNLFNYFANRLRNSENIRLQWNAFRSLVDVKDVKKVIDYLISNNKIGLHILNGIEFLRVDIIVFMMAQKLKTKANISIDPGGSYPYMINDYDVAMAMGNIEKNYTKKLIDKYL
jgi:UDP-2-acetamido-2,6-beta-L-arabino-hexul-4-ose reductase